MGSVAVGSRKHGWLKLAVFALGLAAAALVARPYAGGWNDGSRLATVESLVDYHTLAIEHSIFTASLWRDHDLPAPYEAADWITNIFGTGDKMLVAGHYYSDKSPVPALQLGLVYYIAQKAGGLSARQHADWFCWLMTTLSSGLALAVGMTAMFSLCLEIGLHVRLALLMAASLGFSTMALVYAEHVNNHILFLGVASLLMLELVKLAQAGTAAASWRLAFLGCLVGLGYTIDLGVGPPLIVTAGAWLVYRFRSWRALILFTCGMIPWVLLHHAVNYEVGGTLRPANANPEYFLWPGCSFNPQNMTGGWKHPDLVSFGRYTLALLFGKRGFIGHNLPLYLAVAAAWPLCRRRDPLRPEVIFACAWSVLTVLVYAANSNNLSGLCCSIRWFLPLAVPGFFLAALQLRDNPTWRAPLAILSAWGLELSILMVLVGPWTKHLVPYYWQIQSAAAASVLAWTIATRRAAAQASPRPEFAAESEPRAA